jgi:hypothetical protein
MSILKVRGLGAAGVISDIEPYELPQQAWSTGINARFRNGKVERAPVWRSASTTALTEVDPRFCFARIAPDNNDDLFIGYKNGKVKKWSNNAETDYSLAGYTPSSVEAIWSKCELGGVIYVNRSDRQPWGLVPSGSAFTAITGWNAAWTAKLLRAYGGALVALNVTKSGVANPILVKTSSIVTTPNAFPATWDQTDTTHNATENPLTELEGEIKDAAVLGDELVIYGTKQNFAMRLDGSSNIFGYRRLAFAGGAINANCAVEVQGKHFVFGPTTFYMHDGLTKIDILDGKNREFVYGTMNASKSQRFFVSYNPNREEVSFNYVGTDEHTAFTGGVGCNRAAVLHVPSGTWTFDDAPFVHAAVSCSVAINAPTWATVATTWETVGGSWQDLEDGVKKPLLYVGEANATASLSDRLYAFDPYGKGSLVSAPVDTNATAGMYLERIGIDLDEVNVELRGYKWISSLFPQGRMDLDSVPMEFSVGAADTFGQNPTWTPYQTYDPFNDVKVDVDIGGRFLALRIRYPSYKTVSLSGLDLDVAVLSDG